MRNRQIKWVYSLLLLLGVAALASCGASSAAEGASIPTATPLSTPMPSPTPTSTPLPIANSTQLAQLCGSYFPKTPAVLVGGLAISAQARFGNLAYPGKQLPDNLPLKPYKTSALSRQDTPANPVLHEQAGGYVILICNPSSAPHTVQRVDARIDAITPTSGVQNVAPSCQSPYTPPGPAPRIGCGGADFENEYMHAPFPASASVGATVTATQTASNKCTYASGCTSNYGPLPVTLKPGQTMTIEVGMGTAANPTDNFTQPGLYTFSFGVGVDGAAPVFAAASPATLLAPNVRNWTGAACESAAMLAQIPPATNPPSSYLCPESSAY